MRCCHYLLLLYLSVALVQASEPEVDSIDYGNSGKYLAFPDSLGNKIAIAEQAMKLKGKQDMETIRNVLNWMEQNLKYDPNRPYRWSTYDDVIQAKAYGGCAEQGIVCGVLLKAAGIPVVWVKTMDVAWIWDLKKGRPFKSWSGHVFLEVYVDKKWALLDPGAKLLYKDYSPKARILPGNRFSYHKGNDPEEMIMSTQWEQWKSQTEKYFRSLDESLLPIDEAGPISLFPQAYVIGNSPYYQTMSKMAAESGLAVRVSFNTDYDKYLPQSKGHVLLIETHDGKPIVSLETLEKYLPGASRGLEQLDGMTEVEGTTVVFLDFSKQLKKLKISSAGN